RKLVDWSMRPQAALGQHLLEAVETREQRCSASAARQRRRRRCDDAAPVVGVNVVVQSAIGDELDLALEARDQQQHRTPRSRGAQIMVEEERVRVMTRTLVAALGPKEESRIRREEDGSER